MFLKILLQGVRSTTINTCEHQNPCQNNGVCISTDNGPACECKEIDFTGVHCEEGKDFEFFLMFEYSDNSCSSIITFILKNSQTLLILHDLFDNE